MKKKNSFQKRILTLKNLRDNIPFSKTHGFFWEKIEKINPDVIAEKTGAVHDMSGKLYRINVIDEVYCVDVSGRKIYSAESGPDEYEFEVMVANERDYRCHA